MSQRISLILGLLCLSGTGPALAAEVPGLLLAEDGQARMPIVISTEASESTKSIAAELAEYLQQITGASFEIGDGQITRGIVLGTVREFPDPALDTAAGNARRGWPGSVRHPNGTRSAAAHRRHRAGRLARRLCTSRGAGLPVVLSGARVGSCSFASDAASRRPPRRSTRNSREAHLVRLRFLRAWSREPTGERLRRLGPPQPHGTVLYH